ncbi:MAG: iron-containing alcohol dehydrogenase [Spirochaetaceae bacterium]|jgi:alcohol dehydrogenase class IV|nr:iron-containing alcohol dehydrogenase [Spirochaetaceae bacterium]
MTLNYLMPTRLLMGENCLFEQRLFLVQLGKKACIVTGKHSAKANGAYDDVVETLKANGQGHVLYDGVMNNPTDTCVFEAGKLAKAEGCDFMLAIGGGSPMDAAKAAAVLAVNDISKEEMFNLQFTTALPIAAVPTTAGTGSEVTQYSVLVDTTGPDGKTSRPGGPVKRSMGSPLLFPRCAFLDARYMKNLSRNITVHTALDALSHAVEGFLCLRANGISDMLAKESMALMGDCFEPLLTFPGNPSEVPPEIREKLLLASTLAGMAISQSGTAVPHSMGYHFTLNWGTDHGRANGLLMKPFLTLCLNRERADSSITPRIPALVKALGMDLERFFDIIEQLLGTRERAAEAELAEWGARPMKNAANTYIQPTQAEIGALFRAAVG